MATYTISIKVKTELKQPRRGERETLRDRLLKLLDGSTLQPLDHEGLSQVTRRSLRVKRVK